MKIAYSETFDKTSDVWVLPFWEGPKPAADFKGLEVDGFLKDFKGKNGEGSFCYVSGQRILLMGLGPQDKASVEALRKAYSSAVRAALGKKITKMDVLFPKCRQTKEFLQGIGEGLFLANYSFTYKHDAIQEDPIVLLEKATFVGVEKDSILERVQTIAEGVYWTRDLVNSNADDKLSRFLKAVEGFHSKVKLSVFDKKKLESERMGLILAVNRASRFDPALIQAVYRGNPKSKEQVVLVGKGVVYDTGGLTLKPTDNMLTMKADMAGAATVLSAVNLAARLGLKVNVTALAPLVENSIGSESYKLGDVYSSYSGKTVEIDNTDAEGRLILADAIAYAVRNLNPSCVIDLATLTGACIVALGEEISGLFANDDELAEELLESSERTDELVWRLPLHLDYKEMLKSEIADLANSGASRHAGAIKAALFLHEFAGNVPWAHLDIAGPAYLTKPKHYHPTKATGHGVRLLVDFLERRSS